MTVGKPATPGRLRPLAERILSRLPGSRPLWVAAWALVPWLNAGANFLLGTTTAVWEESRTLALLNYGFLSAAVVIALWGAERIARRLEELEETMQSVLPAYSSERFRELNGVVGPVLATAVTALVFGVTAFLRYGWTSGILRGATWVVIGIALWSFLWTYGALQLGLHRLGREPLARDAARVDPGMGLHPLGAIAFTGLWMLLVWLAPVVMTGLPDVVGVAVGVSVLAAGVAAFFLPLARLHRRMAELKRAELSVARGLYARAYEPVRAAPTLELLERQQPLLGAADALEKRAQALHEWPIDEGTVARVITIVTSVVAMAVGRLILDPLGL
jgi:hypothetical protein